MSGYDDTEIRKWNERIAQAQSMVDSEFLKASKQVALEFLKRVKVKTPKGRTGKLNQSWQIGTPVKQGDTYVITIYNPMEYAEFVEYGHRQQVGRYVPAIGKRLKKPWVEGRFMMRMTEKEIEERLPTVVKNVERRIVEVLDGL